jgi:hypothetical protein
VKGYYDKHPEKLKHFKRSHKRANYTTKMSKARDGLVARRRRKKSV